MHSNNVFELISVNAVRRSTSKSGQDIMGQVEDDLNADVSGNRVLCLRSNGKRFTLDMLYLVSRSNNSELVIINTINYL